MSSQPQAAKLAPNLVEGVTNLARSLVAATRNWTLYPPEHPAVRASFERLSQAIQEATNDAVFSIGITPDNLPNARAVFAAPFCLSMMGPIASDRDRRYCNNSSK